MSVATISGLYVNCDTVDDITNISSTVYKRTNIATIKIHSDKIENEENSSSSGVNTTCFYGESSIIDYESSNVLNKSHFTT